jgi:uncharacterized delta-60 repeat protein
MKLSHLRHTLLVLCALLFGAPALHAQTAGNLDPAFDPNVSLQGATGVATVSVTAVQADGKTIIGGNFNRVGNTVCNGLARLNADGTVDTSFTAAIEVGSTVLAVAPLLGGKLLVSNSFPTSSTGSQFRRLNADGSVDTTFVWPGINRVRTMALQADGKVVVVGVFGNYSSYFRPQGSTTSGGVIILSSSSARADRNCIVRLDANGNRDATFLDPAGETRYYWDFTWLGGVNGLAVQPDGKILLKGDFTAWGGQARNHIARLNADGSLDANFNPSAILWGAGPDGKISAMAVQPDGKIVLAGGDVDTSASAPAVFETVRLNGDGTADATFHAAQYAVDSIAFSGAVDVVSLLAVQADGKIVVGGRFGTVDGQTRIKLARLNGDGTLESTATFDAGTGIGLMTSSSPLILGGTITSALSGLTINATNTLTNGAILSNSYAGGTLSFNPQSGVTTTVGGTLQGTASSSTLNGILTVQPTSTAALGTLTLNSGLASRFTNSAVINTYTGLTSIEGGTLDLNSGLGSTANQSISDIHIGDLSGLGSTANQSITIGNILGLGSTANQSISDIHIGGLSGLGSTANQSITIGNIVGLGSTANQSISDIHIGDLSGLGSTANMSISTIHIPSQSSSAAASGSLVLNSVPDSPAPLAPLALALQTDSTPAASAASGTLVLLPASSAQYSTLNTGTNQLTYSGISGSASLVTVSAGTLTVGGGGSSAGSGTLALTSVTNLLQASGSVQASLPVAAPASGTPYALILQADGGILVGGDFTSVNGQARNRMARLLNDAASETLTVVDPTHVEWQRSGSTAEATQVAFHVSRDAGATWTTVGSGQRIAGGWRMAGGTLLGTGLVRAVAATSGGFIVSESQPYIGLPVFTITTSVSPLVAYPWYIVLSSSIAWVAPPSGTVTGGGIVLAGSPVSLVATPAAGYDFVNWTENGTSVSTSATYPFTPVADRTLVANFALQSFPITTSVASPGSGVIRGGGTFTYDTAVSLVASPAPGYSFANWSENGAVVSSNATFGFTANAARTLVASFTQNTYTVSTVSSPSDRGTVTGGGTFSHGAPVTLVAVPAAGYEFVNWSENGTDLSWSRTLHFTATGNRTLTANFTPVAEISGGANFTGASTFNTYGGSLTITSGSTFTIGTAIVGGVIDRAISINLGFGPRVPESFTITANAAPATGGWAVGAGAVYSGASVTLLAVPAPGFTFASWTENGTVVSTAAEYTFTVTSDRTLLANFTGSSDASLGSLASDQATFTETFDGSRTTYSTRVPVKKKFFTLTPTFVQGGSTMKINGAAASPGGSNPAIALNLGKNSIMVEVTAPDGQTTKTYTVDVNRSAVPNDLDGDGNPDIILQNTAGQVGAWYMDANGKATFSAFISSAALGDWKVVGTVDMDGDGLADIIYQNTSGQIGIWYLDGMGKVASAEFLWSGGLGDWKVVAVADINGDGHADLIFQNGLGQVFVWYMDGAGGISSSGFLCGSVLGDWRIVAVADMNNDGKVDILLQNTVGQIFAWHLNEQNGAAVISTGGFLYGGGLGDWRVTNAGDMNGDGKADIVLQNGIGQIFVWYMNGSGGISKSGFIYGGALGDWRVK